MVRSHRIYLRASSLDTSAAHSPAPFATGLAGSSSPMAARCSWTKSARSPAPDRPNCCDPARGRIRTRWDDATRRVNVRVLAATNRRPAEGHGGRPVSARSVLPARRLPGGSAPLRDRKEDIPVLITHFLRQAGLRFHVAVPAVPVREIEKRNDTTGPATSANCRMLLSAL